MLQHESFVTTSLRGLDRASVPMRLFEKAKRLGIWNPSEVDFAQDAADWQRLAPLEREVLLHLTALFQAGEEAVTNDIVPLLLAVSQEGRVEEELYLTTFLFEEAKHTDFFRRFLDTVVACDDDLSRFHSGSYRLLIYEALPDSMQRLLTDRSPAAQMRAAVTYNMIVEGVLAETGYHAYLSALERNHILPGQCRGVRLVKQDEARHIAYGIFLISRLLAANPELWDVAEATMNELLPLALGVVGEAFGAYPTMPFGLELEEFTNFAVNQFNKRIERIERARTATEAEVARMITAAIEREDA